jgi:hypothetical protein
LDFEAEKLKILELHVPEMEVMMRKNGFVEISSWQPTM